MRVVFVLPSAGGGGGAHSVVQEAVGLSRIGVDVAVAVPRSVATRFCVGHPQLKAGGVENPFYDTVEELSSLLARYQLAIATTALSVDVLRDANELLKAEERPKLAYYVQDYEPLFYGPGSPEWSRARASYALMQDAVIFAKTDWLCSIVEANHNVNVRRVYASIDHDVYFSDIRRRSARNRVTAMVRPKTPRRAPRRTIRILEWIAFEMGSQVEVSYFGCDEAELASLGIRPSKSLECLGVLNREQVANTLRHSDLFLDLSDYQAFGRTGLEGMACGCVPLLPEFGGAHEYAKTEVNAFVVDTRSDEQVRNAVRKFFSASADRRMELRDAAINTALGYSVARAAFSEYIIFRDYL